MVKLRKNVGMTVIRSAANHLSKPFLAPHLSETNP